MPNHRLSLTTLLALLPWLIATGPAQSQSPRTVTALGSDWHFHQGPTAGGLADAVNDSAWEKVSVPHSWSNAEAVPGAGFFTGESWYSRRFPTEKSWKGQRVFLRFEAVSLIAEVFLNGKRLGEHHGGFAAFAYEITDAVAASGDNRLVVRVSNARRPDTSPLGGDFTIFGGIYRPVSILVTGPVNISPLDYASPGIFLKQSRVTRDAATVEAITEINNGGSADSNVAVRLNLVDAAGHRVLTHTESATIPAGKTQPIVQTLQIVKPHLWNGVADPYLYHVEVELTIAGRVVDRSIQPLGLRSERVDPKLGFILNEAAPRQIHGVCLHQEVGPHGWAVTPAEEATDIRQMREMGVDGVRLVHYQHSQSFLDAADKEGLLVWAELTQVDRVNETPEYHDNIRQQLYELVRQNYNHPSIFVWSLYNELGSKTKDVTTPLIAELNQIAHKEDPTRLTTGADSGDTINNLREMVAGLDLISDNDYPGWYWGLAPDIGKDITHFNQMYDGRGLSISEYGAGASIHDHKQGVVSGEILPRGKFHPEEWQSAVHEGNYPAIAAHPEVWGSFLWVMYDFASIGRHEGDSLGVNDKGLITRDRQIRKDAYFFYQATWTTKPMAYITSRRATERTTPTTDVKVYSNQQKPELSLNGHSLGAGVETQPYVFVWRNVSLAEGENKVHVKAGKASDDCVWRFKPGAAQSVTPAL